MFDIQLFANTVTSSADVKINWAFADGDTRLVSIPNPEVGLDAATINQVVEHAVDNDILIGDKTGAEVIGIVQAYTEQTTKTKLDLT